MEKPAKLKRTERLNISLTKPEMAAIMLLAQQEDRDPGYIATFFVRWGLRQYREMDGTSLRKMDQIQLHAGETFEHNSKVRLELRRLAQNEIHDLLNRKDFSDAKPARKERKRA